jgi:hypothetical protein
MMIKCAAMAWMMVLGALVAPSTSMAMEFITHPSADRMPAVTAILASGPIEDGDVERLSRFLATAPIRNTTAIYLASPGGSLYEGMRLGIFFKDHRIKTVVEGDEVCASACALAFLGGHDKAGKPWRSSSSNSLLGFHAFSSAGSSMQDENETQMVVSHVLQYGREVEAPLELLILNFATPSNSVYWLDQEEICSLGIKLWDVPGDRFIC